LGKINLVGLIPARSGSLRIRGKNIRHLAGHPLLAYSILSARQSGLFNRIVVSTESELYRDIALHYGAEVPALRPEQYATSVSPDIEWVRHILESLGESFDAFAILRPTSPFRSAETLRRAWEEFRAAEGVDSLRAVQKCKEHPGKMWLVSEDRLTMKPFIDQAHMAVPYYASQYQALPEVYIQNSSLEIAWARVVPETGTKEGRSFAPFFTQGAEGFVLDYEEDWDLAEMMVRKGTALPPADVPTFTAYP
jgi:N-acylneuraminate cytidylyltransferase